jgi:hypothetical protein
MQQTLRSAARPECAALQSMAMNTVHHLRLSGKRNRVNPGSETRRIRKLSRRQACCTNRRGVKQRVTPWGDPNAWLMLITTVSTFCCICNKRLTLTGGDGLAFAFGQHPRQEALKYLYPKISFLKLARFMLSRSRSARCSNPDSNQSNYANRRSRPPRGPAKKRHARIVF